ncbi:MAG: hypothetical protein WCL07_00995 [bacterium]
MPTMLQEQIRRMWQYRWLQIVLGNEELGKVIAFGEQFGWGEPWKVRLMGAVAMVIAKRGDVIAQQLVASNLTMVPNILIPDCPISELIPKNSKLRKAVPAKVKGLAKASSNLVAMIMPLAVYEYVVKPVLSEQEQVEWSSKIDAAADDADKLTGIIAEWMMLVRSRHGTAYEDILAQTRENATQEMFDFIKDTLCEYEYLSKQKSLNKYEELVATQDVEGLVDAYLAVK